MQPDYEMAEMLEINRPEQLKALGDAFRHKILILLMEHAATTQDLAERLKTPNSTVAHHLQVLTDAGLIKVVQTRQVKALTQKYFGRTARSYVSILSAADADRSAMVEIFFQALRTIAAQPDDQNPLRISTGYARIARSQADAFSKRLHQLVTEFEHLSSPGEDMYGFIGAIYREHSLEL